MGKVKAEMGPESVQKCDVRGKTISSNLNNLNQGLKVKGLLKTVGKR